MVTTPRRGPHSLQPGHWQSVRFHGTSLYKNSVPFPIPPGQLGPEVPKHVEPSGGSPQFTAFVLLQPASPVLGTVSAVTVVTALGGTPSHITHGVSTALPVCQCTEGAAVKCDSNLTLRLPD